ncbi:glucose-6-phosphate isomerase [uncultured Gemmiger sp.]|uniref:glucose-6-phosphate isomerase n=1 Tax=uncultured Gemmiger sp. TaxID=1623490 RepID=UPI0025E89E6D|nr:glucose-6-phosphate isomerase [uncultured Gemmiger sp.]
MSVKFNGKHLAKFIRPEEYAAIYPQVEAAHKQLAERTGPGNDFLGWMDLPKSYDKEEFARIKQAAEKIRSDSDVLLVAGIGGSYLGARAVIEACRGVYHNDIDDGPKIYFCGNTISPTSLNDIIRITKGKRFSINVISKSGTTTETALAFRVLRKLLEDQVGPEEANKRIYATTDRCKGTLKELADAQGWPTFVVPDDVGGRYSVLTAVGLLPIACAGIDIDALMQGAADAEEAYSVLSPDNDAYRYAMTRNILYRKGRSVETLACFEPDFAMMNEWYKQLFGESEGKDQKGLMPTSCIFSTDLHSMGQFLQDGSRIMFETYVDVKNTREDFYIPELEGNFDGLNFLANQNMSVVNRKAMEGTILAHTDGGVPLGVIEVDSLGAYDIGYLIYFFWKACAVSGYLLSVNPFDQPGVESYKKNMFALLGKPGYEDRKAELEAKLQD